MKVTLSAFDEAANRVIRHHAGQRGVEIGEKVQIDLLERSPHFVVPSHHIKLSLHHVLHVFIKGTDLIP